LLSSDGQLLQRCAGAAQLLGALAHEFDGVRRFLFLVLLDAQLRKIAQGGFVGKIVHPDRPAQTSPQQNRQL